MRVDMGMSRPEDLVVRPIHIRPETVARFLSVFGGALLTAHLVTLFLKFGLGHAYAGGLVPMFHLDGEMNVPSLSSSLLLFSSAVIAIISSLTPAGGWKDRYSWLLIAIVFIILSFDETLRLHEQIGGFVMSVLPGWGWELPHFAAMTVAGALLLPWFFRLERDSQIRFVIAGTIYITGAVGMEHIATVYYNALGIAQGVASTLTGDVFVTLEECMELFGVGFFLHAMIRRLGGLTIISQRFTPPLQ
jgi:hypothetical protein